MVLSIDEFGKISVICNQDSLLTVRPLQHFPIRNTRFFLCNRSHILFQVVENTNDDRVAAFINEKLHASAYLNIEQRDFIRRVSDGSEHIFTRKMWVRIEDFVYRPACG